MKKKHIIKCKDCGFTTKWSEDLTEIAKSANKHKIKFPKHRLELHTEIRQIKVFT